MDSIMEVHGLQKSFGEVQAVCNVSFQVREGELFAFLGANGAGKSTTIRILCGIMRKDGGEVRINGKELDENPWQIKREIGVVFQNSVLDKSLSVKDNLQSRAALYGIIGKEFEERLKTLAKALDFEDIIKRPVGKLSGGERRRVDIARALMHKPRILILDEPTAGLDPQSRKVLWGVIDGLRKEDKLTVFLTTHYLEEAAEADYVVILDKGKIAAEGPPLQLKNAYTGDFINLYGVTEEKVQALQAPYEKIAGGYRIAVENTAAATKLIVAHEELFSDYEIVKGKMDDVFLAVTGRNLAEEEK